MNLDSLFQEATNRKQRSRIFDVDSAPLLTTRMQLQPARRVPPLRGGTRARYPLREAHDKALYPCQKAHEATAAGNGA
jgi:hypothetical protein